MSEWSHFANAKHIDRIIAHAKANPKAWNEPGRDAAWYSAWDAARNAVRPAVYDVAWYSAWDAARNAANDAVGAARFAARGAVLALVAWDYAGGLMDLPAEQVKVLALLGDQAALLMYPVIAAMETTQELV